jgi:microcystin-dependent protein
MVVESDLIARGLAASDLELGLGTAPRFNVYIRDKNYNIVDQLTEFNEFTFIPRFNGIGTWRLKIAAESLAASILTPFHGIVVKRVVEGAEKTIFSGSAGSEWEETRESLTVAGWCDNKLLESTARPTPAQAQGPYASEYYVITGIASTVMRQVVFDNIAGAAPTEWKIPQLALAANPFIGSTVTLRARFDPLLILLATIAAAPGATGLGFKILQSDTIQGQIDFIVYAPQDKHIDTIFGIENYTVSDYKFTYKLPSHNYFQVAGGDDFGLYRTVVEGGDTTSIAEVGRRIPLFVDKRGVTDLSELTQALAEQIAGAVSTRSVEVVPVEVPAYQLGVDYDLGDYVTAVVKGVQYPRIIRDIEYTLSPTDGTFIKLNIADPFASDDDLLAQHLNSLSHRLENLEKNWNVPDNSLIPAMFHETIRDYVGDLKLTARSSAQPAWLVCDGSAISRTVYSSLFAAIGTTFGVGNGTTTFNIPDFRGRGPIGVGNTYTLAQLGGSDTISPNFGNHSHNHSHGGGTLVYSHVHNERAHTHPGSHDHGLDAHRHQMSHDHDVNIGQFDSGKTNIDSVAVGHASLGSGSTDHHHSVDPPNTTTTPPNNTVTGSGEKVVGGGSFLSTISNDTFAPAASYTGAQNGPNNDSWSGVTSTDTTSTAVSGSNINVKNPFQCVNITIYAGVQI